MVHPGHADEGEPRAPGSAAPPRRGAPRRGAGARRRRPSARVHGRRRGTARRKVLRRLLERLGVPAAAHGFRPSFRDWAAEETEHRRESRFAGTRSTSSASSESRARWTWYGWCFRLPAGRTERAAHAAEARELDRLDGHGVLLRIRPISGQVLDMTQGSLHPALYRLDERWTYGCGRCWCARPRGFQRQEDARPQRLEQRLPCLGLPEHGAQRRDRLRGHDRDQPRLPGRARRRPPADSPRTTCGEASPATLRPPENAPEFLPPERLGSCHQAGNARRSTYAVRRTLGR